MLTARLEVLLDEIIDPRTTRLRRLLGCIVGGAAAYGVCIGSFQGSLGERSRMMLYTAIKVPLLLLGTAAICLPGFVIATAVLGLGPTLKRVLLAIFAGQAALALALCSLGPLILFFYQSGVNHRAALLVNAGLFACAAGAGQIVMRRRCAALVREEPRHRLLLIAWSLLHTFVGIQMGWLLRPFVGGPGMPSTFFREEPFSNAYVVVAELLFGSL